MRLPKKILINNRPWKVIKDKKISVCSFGYPKMEMKIGTLGNSDREILTGFMHEVTEISAIERGVRSQKCMLQHEAGDFVFSASHKQFSDIVSDVSSVVGNMMKLG